MHFQRHHILFLIITTLAFPALTTLHAEEIEVLDRYGVSNITIDTESGKTLQITDSGRDKGAVVSQDGKRVFFVRNGLSTNYLPLRA